MEQIRTTQLDPEVRELCEALNKIPGIETTASCCGHGKSPFQIWFKVTDYSRRGLAVLGRALNGRYGFVGREWRVLLDPSDVDPEAFLLEGPEGKAAYKEAQILAQRLEEHLNPEWEHYESFWSWVNEERDRIEHAAPDCPDCGGVGVSIGSWPQGGKDCSACSGSGIEANKRPVVELLRTRSGRYAVSVDDFVHGPDDWPYTPVASWPLDERVVLPSARGLRVPEGALAEKLREVKRELRQIGVTQERLEGEPVEGSRRLEKLRRCYWDLLVLIGHLEAEDE